MTHKYLLTGIEAITAFNITLRSYIEMEEVYMFTVSVAESPKTDMTIYVPRRVGSTKNTTCTQVHRKKAKILGPYLHSI